MEEAKYSFNVKFNLQGFDCQFTVRADSAGQECIAQGITALGVLSAKGAKPDRRWEAAKNNNRASKPESKPNGLWQPPGSYKDEPERVCPVCGKANELELITTKYGRRFKCQRCGKWLPKALQPTDEELAEMNEQGL